jgi:hypothetical protein
VAADDLVAVQTLSVRIPAQAALDLLEGDLAVRVSKLLSRVPFGVGMVEAEAADLPETVSALRVCDVVLWMHHRTDHQQGSCTGA